MSLPSAFFPEQFWSTVSVIVAPSRSFFAVNVVSHWMGDVAEAPDRVLLAMSPSVRSMVTVPVPLKLLPSPSLPSTVLVYVVCVVESALWIGVV